MQYIQKHLSSIILFVIVCFLVISIGSYLLNEKQKIYLQENKVTTNEQSVENQIGGQNIKNGNSLILQSVENLYNSNNFTEANKTLDENLKIDSNNVELLLAKASTLAQQGSLEFKEKEYGEKAREVLKKVLKLDSENVQGLTLMGYTYEIQQDYINTHKFYDKALKISPNNVLALTQKGHAYDLEGKTEEAKVTYEKALKFGGVGKTLVGVAKSSLASGEIKDAIKKYTEALRQSDNAREKAGIYHSLGALNELDIQSPESEKYYNLSIESDPTLALPYLGLAKELFKKALVEKDNNKKQILIDKSFENLQKALKINPDQSIASLQLAIQSIAIGNKKFGETVLSKVLVNVDRDITLSVNDKKELKDMIKTIINSLK